VRKWVKESCVQGVVRRQRGVLIGDGRAVPPGAPVPGLGSEMNQGQCGRAEAYHCRQAPGRSPRLGLATYIRQKTKPI
jgi:hypothetical protein